MARRLKASNPTKATSRKPQPVAVRNIAHPAIWKTAMRVAGNKRECITVEAWGRVVVKL